MKFFGDQNPVIDRYDVEVEGKTAMMIVEKEQFLDNH